jgi:hypothetical protein
MIFFSPALRSKSGSFRRSAVQVEQVEGDQYDLDRGALELVLQHGEVGRAVGGRHDDLAVDDRRARLDVPGITGDLPEAFGPVIFRAG